MKFRERKNKGQFSVLDDTETIIYEPKITEAEQKEIETQTQLVDAPIQKRLKVYAENDNSTSFNIIQPHSNEVGSNDFNHLQPHSVECPSTSFNIIQPHSNEVGSNDFNHLQPHSQPHSKQPSMTELKVLSYLNSIYEKNQEIKTTKNEIATAVGISLKGAETAIRRLIQKSFLKKEIYQSGRYTGFTKYQLLEASKKVLISISFNIIQPPSQPPSYKEINNKLNYIFIPENLKTIGLRIEHIKTEREDLQETLNHLSFSMESGDFSSTNPLATVRSVLNENKVWTSGKFIQEQKKILDEQDKKIAELRNLKQQELIKKFEIYKLENPNFVSALKKENKFTTSEEVLNQIAFSKWQEEQNEL